MAEGEKYLGKTIKFPVEFNEYGRAELVSGIDTIPQSINMILLTPKGSRFMLPEYGSDIELLMFEPNDDILSNLLFFAINDALEIWEKRIKVIDINFNFKNGQKPSVESEIIYKILKSNEFASFIFPYYREIIY